MVCTEIRPPQIQILRGAAFSYLAPRFAARLSPRIACNLPDVALADGVDAESAPQHRFFNGLLTAVSGREEYDDVGGQDYVYVDLQPVREAFEKRREVYLTEESSDVTVSIDIEAPPELVWRLSNDIERAPAKRRPHT